MIAFAPGLDQQARSLTFERVGPTGAAILRVEVELRL
jgi:hypothetical protein